MEMICCNCGETCDVDTMVFDEKTKEWYCVDCARHLEVIEPENAI